MSVKFYWILAVLIVSLSSCLKQSIADAMQDSPETKKITATLSYEINGSKVNVTVADADRQVAGSRRLSCEKSNGFVLGAVIDNGDFVFTFFTDSLRLGNYKYLGSLWSKLCYHLPGTAAICLCCSDNMNFNITNNTNGHISGNFTGKLTPYTNPAYGAIGSVIITNGSFTNIPVFN